MTANPKTTGLIYSRGTDTGVEVLNGNPWFGDKISLGFVSWSRKAKADEVLADIALANSGNADARLRLEALTQ